MVKLSSKKFMLSASFLRHTEIRALSLMVNDLRLETKGSGSSLAASYVQKWALCSNRPANFEAGGSDSEEFKKCPSTSLQSCDLWMFVKENPNRKKRKVTEIWILIGVKFKAEYCVLVRSLFMKGLASCSIIHQ